MSLFVDVTRPLGCFLALEQQLRKGLVDFLRQEQTAAEDYAERTAFDFVEAVAELELGEVELECELQFAEAVLDLYFEYDILRCLV